MSESDLIYVLVELVENADLSLGLNGLQGKGLGAVCLTIIAVAVVRSRMFNASRFSDLLRLRHPDRSNEKRNVVNESEDAQSKLPHNKPNKNNALPSSRQR